MLENLDQVNWAELGAPQIPDLLREIQANLCGTEQRHSTAWDQLFELIFPEGIIDMWDWSGPGRMMQTDLPHQVVPFLLEILEDTDSKPCQSIIISHFRDMCTYWHVSLWVGDPGQPRHEAYVKWAERLKEVMRRGTPLYKPLLDDPYPHLDNNVRYLLKELDEGET